MVRLAIVAAFLLMGCASSVQQGKTTPRSATAYDPSEYDEEEEDDVECKEEVPTGSHIHYTLCRDEMERIGERKDVERWMTRPSVQGVVK